MRPFLARFSEPVWSGHLPSWADFITTTPVFRFSVHTGSLTLCSRPGALASPLPGCGRRIRGSYSGPRLQLPERTDRLLQHFDLFVGAYRHRRPPDRRALRAADTHVFWD